MSSEERFKLFDKLFAEGKEFLKEDEYPPLVLKMIEDGTVIPGEEIPIGVLLIGEPRSDFFEGMSEERKKKICETIERLERELADGKI